MQGYNEARMSYLPRVESWESVQSFHKTAKNSLATLKFCSKKEFRGIQKEMEKLIKQLKEIKHNYKH